MLIQSMKDCEQTKGLSVYQHGLLVWDKASSLLRREYDGFRLPRFDEKVLDNTHDLGIMKRYTVMHDCGKPKCRVVIDGSVRFPDHANVSKAVYAENFPEDTIVANLIGWDMDIHTMSAVEIDERLKLWSVEDACSLIVSATAEIHANAAMFGGIESISFKQKFRQLDRRVNQISKHLFG